MLTLPVQLSVSACEGRGCVCSHCTLCDPHPRRFRPVAGDGPSSARIAIVGEAPGEMEEIKGRPFVGPSGRLLEQALTEVGLVRNNCFLTNAVLCRPPGNRDPKTAELAACNQRLLSELHALPNLHVLVILGSSAVKAVMGRTQGITELVTRTEWSEQFSCHVLYSVHPAAILRNPDNYQDLHRTLLRARDLLDLPKAPLSVPRVPYVLETHVSAAVSTLRRLYRHATGRIACDIETAGEEKKDALDWRKGWITQLVLYTSVLPAPYILPRRVLFHPDVFVEMQRLFGRHDLDWVWHNGKFDLQFLWAADFTEAHLDTDTMLLHKCLDERSGTHSLKSLAGWYFGDGSYGEEKEGFTDPRYHAKDGLYTYRLHDLIRRDLDREPSSKHGYPGPAFRHDRVIAPAWGTIAAIERLGVLIDQEKLPVVKRDMRERLMQFERACQHLVAGSFHGKEAHDSLEYAIPCEEVCLNVRSTREMCDYLYGYLGLPKQYDKKSTSGGPTVNEEALIHLAEEYPSVEGFCRAVLAYRAEQKLYATYVKGAEKASEWDGCVHTHFGFDPVTGRPSSKNLNIQNIPRLSPIKRLYIARPGYLFFEADFNAQEVRGAALLSRDPDMLRAATDPEVDFHTATSRMVFSELHAQITAREGDVEGLYDLCVHHFRQIAVMHSHAPMTAKKLAASMRKQLRVLSKIVIFRTLYGTEAPGMCDFLLQVGIDATISDAQDYINACKRRFPVCAAWLVEQGDNITSIGFVDTPYGHRRRKPVFDGYAVLDTHGESERQAMNSPIQSLASDMTVRSVRSLHQELTASRIGACLFFVHDAIYGEIEIGRLEEGIALVKAIMEHSLDDIQDPNFYVPFPVEVKVGPGWGELYADEDTDEGPGWHTRYQGAPFCALPLYAARSA